MDGLRNSKVELLIVVAFIASLKTAEAMVLTGTPVVPFNGVTDDTVGGVISGYCPIGKLVIDNIPTITITTEITIAVTGRRIKVSAIILFIIKFCRNCSLPLA